MTDPGVLDALGKLTPELAVLVVFVAFAWLMIQAWIKRDEQWQRMLTDQRAEDREAGKGNAHVMSAALSEMAAALRAGLETQAEALRETSTSTREHIGLLVGEHERASEARSTRNHDALQRIGGDLKTLAEINLKGPKR